MSAFFIQNALINIFAKINLMSLPYAEFVSKKEFWKLNLEKLK